MLNDDRDASNLQRAAAREVMMRKRNLLDGRHDVAMHPPKPDSVGRSPTVGS